MSTQPPTILEIAIPCPLRRAFDYLAPTDTPTPQHGMRVLVPFGHRKVVGIVVRTKQESEFDLNKLKPIIKILDPNPLFDQHLFELCTWASDYYQHPIGEVFATALPKLLRSDHPAQMQSIAHYDLTPEGAELDLDTIKRATTQVKLLTLMRQHQTGLSKIQLNEAGISNALIKTGLEKHWLDETMLPLLPKTNPQPEQPPTLNEEQQAAVNAITANLDQFNTFLLYGITGSGKTEVYFQAMQSVLDQGKQVLVLIPEISLTPQTISRFNKRFKQPIVALHSGLNNKERQHAWLLAKHDKAKIIIGTRSAIYTPLPKPGMIVIDEEHDASFKQQDSFRYHARDLAIVRANKLNIPIVLGSATPSLESLHNALENKYQLLTLKQRAGNACVPHFKTISLKGTSPEQAFATETIHTIKEHLAKQQQVLIFINRRGYAPILFCQSCEWVPECQRCDSKMVIHKKQHRIHCHHCGAQQALPPTCPNCGSKSLLPIGHGTQRLEETLSDTFPGTDIIRVDRDSTRGKNKLHQLLEKIHQGGNQILVGTQMLAKGHHFPNVTLVVILDIDTGFISSDLRAAERTGQLVMQVAGRAGRAEKQGEVLIQTQQPDQLLLKTLITEDYIDFAKALMQERKVCQFPPYGYLALIRAEAKQAKQAMQFLEAVKSFLQHHNISVFGPVAAPMQKKAGFFRAQLLLQTPKRGTLHQCLKHILKQIDELPLAKQARWSLDVDPMELG